MFTTRRKSARLRKNIRSFRNKRIDYSKYIKDFYLENGLAYISCNVRGYYDVIDVYSVNGYEWLNDSFARFIESNAYYIPPEYPIVLEICGTKFTKPQQDTIVQTIADYYSLKLGDKQLDLDVNRKRALTLLLFGAVFFGLVWLLDYIMLISSIKETILVIFWFFIWEFADLVLLARSDLRASKTDSAQLACMKVIFQEKFRDKPDDTEVADQIIAEIFHEDISS